MSTLRIRPDNGTIRELNIPKEKLEVLEKVVSSPQITDDVKKLMIKKFAQGIAVLYMRRDSIARGCL